MLCQNKIKMIGSFKVACFLLIQNISNVIIKVIGTIGL